MKAFRFEFKKELAKRSNRIIFFGLLLYFLAILVYMGYADRSYREDLHSRALEMQSTYQLERTTSLTNLEGLEAIGEDDDRSLSDRDFYDRKLAMFKSIHSKYLVQSHYYGRYAQGEELNPKIMESILVASRGLRRDVVQGYEEGLIDDDWLLRRGFKIDELKKEISDFDYLEEDGSLYEISPYSRSLKNYIGIIFTPINIFLILIFIAIISIESFMGEFNEGSYKTIYSSPLSRRKILISKFLAKSIFNILIFSLAGSLVCLVLFFIYPRGNFNYPVRVSRAMLDFSIFTSASEDLYLPVYRIYMKEFLGLAFLLAFQTIFSISLAIITRDSNTSFSLILLFMVISYLGIIFEGLTELNRVFNPWAYMDLKNSFNSAYKETLYYGMGLGGIYMLLAGFWATRSFSRRDLA